MVWKPCKVCQEINKATKEDLESYILNKGYEKHGIHLIKRSLKELSIKEDNPLLNDLAILINVFEHYLFIPEGMKMFKDAKTKTKDIIIYKYKKDRDVIQQKIRFKDFINNDLLELLYFYLDNSKNIILLSYLNYLLYEINILKQRRKINLAVREIKIADLYKVFSELNKENFKDEHNKQDEFNVHGYEIKTVKELIFKKHSYLLFKNKKYENLQQFLIEELEKNKMNLPEYRLRLEFIQEHFDNKLQEFLINQIDFILELKFNPKELDPNILNLYTLGTELAEKYSSKDETLKSKSKRLIELRGDFWVEQGEKNKENNFNGYIADIITARSLYKKSNEEKFVVFDKKFNNSKEKVEYGKFTTEIDISSIIEFSEIYVNSCTLENLLSKLVNNELIPNKDSVQRNLNVNIKNNPIFFNLHKVSIDSNYNPSAPKSPDEFNFKYFYKNTLNLCGILLNNIILKLDEYLGFSKEHFKNQFTNKWKVDSDIIQLILPGLGLYFEIIKEINYPTYISNSRLLIEKNILCTDTLITKVERVVRLLCKKLDIVTSNDSSKGDFFERPLTTLYSDEELYKKLGLNEDEFLYTKMILVDNLGMNLRNEVCHGFISFYNYDFQKTHHLFICLLIFLSKYQNISK